MASGEQVTLKPLRIVGQSNGSQEVSGMLLNTFSSCTIQSVGLAEKIAQQALY